MCLWAPENSSWEILQLLKSTLWELSSLLFENLLSFLFEKLSLLFEDLYNGEYVESILFPLPPVK